MARFATTSEKKVKRSLADYVAAMRPNQTAIYYIVGEGADRLAASPQLEGFRARGVEVLLLSDPVDAFWVQTAVGFDGKPFKSATQGAADINSIERVEGKEAAPENAGDVAAFVALAKQTLETVVEDVRVSDRLSESPACLVAPEFGPDLRLQQILASHGQAPGGLKPVLEINPSHALVVALESMARSGDKNLFEDAVWLLFDEARLMDGEAPHDAPAFASRLTRILSKALKA